MHKKQCYILGLTIVYFIISLIGILHHEIWLDEAHHWLLARDSFSFKELIYNTRYEGHPILWNILLFYISRLTLNPFWMQLLHILISTAAIFIFLKKAPFSWLFKTLFIFGYFIIFEYNIISRNYMLGVLFLFLACSLFKEKDSRFSFLCFFLAMAANTHAIFGIISFAFFLTLLYENWQRKILFVNRTHVYGYLIFIIGFTIALIQIVPPTDTTFFDHAITSSFKERMTPGLVSFFKGLMPIPDFRTIHFWNSNLLVNLNKSISAILSIAVYIIPLILFYKKKTALVFIYTGLFGIQLFFFFTNLSATRYFGITYILFIITLWISKEYYPRSSQNGFKNIRNLKKTIIYSILFVQFIGGIIAFSMDLTHSFSNGKDVFLVLKEKKASNYMVVTTFCQGTIISPYLRKKVYFLCSESYQSHCPWNRNNQFSLNLSNEEVMYKLSKLLDDKPIIFIGAYNFIGSKKEHINIKLLKKLNNYVVRGLDYHIYEISKK
ncbi:hypothetical protein [Flavivirga spongiicola]|uniref:Glycosyltransferase RgtA/B/C/D-like domain-containing protein n=1 Tax=Flavivirga spongiicola TaxID=421621 RepID=A0ABU7XS13_9FLAO|nr:hypothetical protein [Flavivirga sp. MEBiC05379]MDO5977699.1 hypothetical protein [Flavivirga sp. MEBiC05379]